MDAAGHARIADFGFPSIVTQGPDLTRNASAEDAYGAQWIAPEVLDNSETYSKEADVFSFAGVTIEVRCR